LMQKGTWAKKQWGKKAFFLLKNIENQINDKHLTTKISRPGIFFFAHTPA
jgi:hypothetical protein